MKSELIKGFQETFKYNNDLDFYFSPGRINLIGEHIDYNGGFVMPLAITLGTYGASYKRCDSIIRIFSANFSQNGILEFDFSKKLEKNQDFNDYAKGMVYVIKNAGYDLKYGFDLYINSNLPTGASLSSSASLELLIGLILNDYNNLGISNYDLALFGQKAENQFVGLSCGIMDQFAVSMSKENTVIYLNTATIEYKYIPLNLGDNVILIMNTNKSRKLTESKYNERVSECQYALSVFNEHGYNLKNLCELPVEKLEEALKLLDNDNVKKRVKHVVLEQNRVLKTIQALENNDIESVGKYVSESHISLNDDYEVAGFELDTIVKEALKVKGVLGARMIGAGFAGCAIAIVNKNAVNDVIKTVAPIYKEKTGYDAGLYIATGSNGTYKL